MSMEPDAFLEQQYEERTHIPDDFWDSEDADLEDADLENEEDEHSVFTTAQGDGSHVSHCHCGWSGDQTNYSQATADAIFHERSFQDES